MVSNRKSAALDPNMVIADGEPLNLHNRYLAAVLAWLIPGAGHFYQRRYAKSSIFFLSIISSFVLGMFVGGGRCVYASWNSVEKRWQYVIQAGVGLPAMPAVYQAYYGRPGQFMSPPSSIREIAEWNAQTASGLDMGTLYTMIAGLLNVLVIFDAFSGPLPPPVSKPKGKGNSNEPQTSPNADNENKVARTGPPGQTPEQELVR